MGVLSNPKHEAFAQALSKGINCSEAYKNAGFKENATNGYRLKNNEEIQARIDEIMTKNEERFGRIETQAINAAAIDKAWVMKRMVREAENAERASERVRALELVGKELNMFVNRSISLDISADFANLDNAEAILAAVAKELGDDTAATLRALVTRGKAPGAPLKTIEHDASECIIDGEESEDIPSSELDDKSL